MLLVQGTSDSHILESESKLVGARGWAGCRRWGGEWRLSVQWGQSFSLGKWKVGEMEDGESCPTSWTVQLDMVKIPRFILCDFYHTRTQQPHLYSFFCRIETHLFVLTFKTISNQAQCILPYPQLLHFLHFPLWTSRVTDGLLTQCLCSPQWALIFWHPTHLDVPSLPILILFF